MLIKPNLIILKICYIFGPLWNQEGNIKQPYFTISFCFTYEKCKELNFVEKIYTSFFNNNFKYLKPCYEATDWTLGKIINWNQNKLQNKFDLGFDEDISNDYKQIYLSNKNYNEIRLFWIYEKDYIFLNLIVPLEDIFIEHNNISCYFKDKIFELINLCKIIFRKHNVELVETLWELDGSENLTDIFYKEFYPIFNPFGIVPNYLFNKLDLDFKSKYNLTEGTFNYKIFLLKNIILI